MQVKNTKNISSDSNKKEVSSNFSVKVSLTTMPPTTNSLYKGFGRNRYVDSGPREKKESMAWEARAQYRGKPLAGDLRVEVHLRWGTRRNHDVDNIKSLLDSMTGILWGDDGQIVDLRVTKRYEKGNEGLELTCKII